MTLKSDDRLGLEMRFHVQVSEIDLGSWSKCAGLSVEFQPKEIIELGANEYTQFIPGQVKYGSITLTRAITKADSKKVMDWLRDQSEKNTGSLGGVLIGSAIAAVGPLAMVAAAFGGSKSAGAGTATITLRDAWDKDVYSWTLRNVFPKKWTGPSLDGKSSNVATETLELVHEGFL